MEVLQIGSVSFEICGWLSYQGVMCLLDEVF